MTGLNLESFLYLLRADAGIWLSLGVVLAVLGLLAWTGWGSRRALRKCLVVSLLVHLTLLAVAGESEWALRLLGPAWDVERPEEHIRDIQVVSEDADGRIRPDRAGRVAGAGAGSAENWAGWDRPGVAALAALNAGTGLALNRPDVPEDVPLPRQERPEAPPPLDVANPELSPPEAPPVEPRTPEANQVEDASPPAAAEEIAAHADAADLPAIEPPAPRRGPEPAVPAALRDAGRIAPAAPAPEPRPGRSTPASTPRERSTLPLAALPVDLGAGRVSPPLGPTSLPEGTGTGTEAPPVAASEPDPGPDVAAIGPARRPSPTPAPPLAMPGLDAAARLRPEGLATAPVLRPTMPREPVAVARRAPAGSVEIPRAPLGDRALPEVPEVYRPRLDPNRSAQAQRAGASSASEEAVERALAWLARHQDDDGRWDAATEHDSNNNPLPGANDFTVHCPAGDVCFGPCHYWEADTAMTGLALLAYLGAGYTHRDGKHASVVARGLNYLVSIQKPDGDLRGPSRAVGMYCHAMAALALCEAYALTGDSGLRDPARRAVEFLVRAQAADGLSWRYAPGAAVGDTSILGWVILVLKSAKEVRFPVPAHTLAGASRWLRLVASGPEAGLAVYQPGRSVTPTMTAEAWVCRQFLGAGGPGPASNEAARYLLQHIPGESEEFNVYYWYYATLAMYQHGGADWTRWNAAVRDQLVRRQQRSGHKSGSWDPDNSQWGPLGGRIYTTALATLTLEVYYRYLRLYDAPGTPPVLAPLPEGPGDPSVRRATRDAP